MIPRAQPLSGGLVIMFEGIDGVGKTTQLGLVREALEAAGWLTLSTRNLGGTPIGEALREVTLSPLERSPMADFYISLAIQAALMELVENARSEGKIILMDRGPLSLAAYHVYGRGIDESIGWQHVSEGMNSYKADAILLYQTDVQTAVERGRQQSGKADYYESQPLSYFERVADGYAAAAQRYPVTIVDAGQPMAQVQQETLRVITQVIKQKLGGPKT